METFVKADNKITQETWSACFLSTNPGNWIWPIQQCFEQHIGSLFYISRIDICLHTYNIMNLFLLYPQTNKYQTHKSNARNEKHPGVFIYCQYPKNYWEYRKIIKFHYPFLERRSSISKKTIIDQQILYIFPSLFISLHLFVNYIYFSFRPVQ